MMTDRMKVCLAALAKQSLVRKGHAWRCGKRGFSYPTVRALIDRGLARQIGDRVIALVYANDNAPT